MQEKLNFLILKLLLDRSKLKKEKERETEKIKENFFHEKRLQDKIRNLNRILKDKLNDYQIHFRASSPANPLLGSEHDSITKMVFMANIMKELSSFVQSKLTTKTVEQDDKSFLTIDQKLYILTEEELLDIIERF